MGITDGIRAAGLLLGPLDRITKPSGHISENTDDHPSVLFGAPLSSYSKADKPSARLMWLLGFFNDSDDALKGIQFAGSADFRERLAKFMQARNHYLRGLTIEEAR